MSFLQFCRDNQAKYAHLGPTQQRDALSKAYLGMDDTFTLWLADNRLAPGEDSLIRAGWTSVQLIKDDFDVNMDVPLDFPPRLKARLVRTIMMLQHKELQKTANTIPLTINVYIAPNTYTVPYGAALTYYGYPLIKW